jgi:hypothetical protein
MILQGNPLNAQAAKKKLGQWPWGKVGLVHVQMDGRIQTYLRIIPSLKKILCGFVFFSILWDHSRNWTGLAARIPGRSGCKPCESNQ